MSFETWITFVTVYTVLSLIPGPSVLMVVTQALAHGRRAAFHCVLGDIAGGVIIISASLLGLGAILATSSLAFGVLKWAGVAYLAWLGSAQIWQAYQLSQSADQRQAAPAAPPKHSARKSLRAGFLTGVLNPKAIMFYMAFLSQFIDPSSASLPQVLVLMLSSSCVVLLVLGGYALAASAIAQHLRTPRTRAQIGYASGTALLGGSVWVASTR